MTVEEALVILEKSLEQGRLSRVQELVFRQVCEGNSYGQIAANSGYDAGYIKNIASNLWRTLSKALGEKVTKSNVQSVLKRCSYPTVVLYRVPVIPLHANNGLNGLRATADLLDLLGESVQRQPESPFFPLSIFTFAQAHSAPSTIFLEDGHELRMQRREENLSCLLPILKLDAKPTATNRRCDWGEAIDTSLFYGRTAELTTLQQWIVDDRCRLVALLGMGGIGKTALSVKLAQLVENEFEYVIWRSLRHAPPLQELLVNLIQFLDDELQDNLPENTDYSVARLIECLRKHRCLVILDNAESILCGSDVANCEMPDDSLSALPVGCYPYRDKVYGELFKQIGEASHQSCLILTSREKPKEVAILEGDFRPVRSLRLQGLGLEAKELIKTKGLSCSEDELQELVERYDGHPLALMSISETIKELFNGNTSYFLKENLLLFGDMCELLDQQFLRLSKLEKEVMYWLAVNRVSVSFTALFDDILSLDSKQALTETLCCLSRRSLIEVSSYEPALFSLHSLVRDYITNHFIQENHQKIQL